MGFLIFDLCSENPRRDLQRALIQFISAYDYAVGQRERRAHLEVRLESCLDVVVEVTPTRRPRARLVEGIKRVRSSQRDEAAAQESQWATERHVYGGREPTRGLIIAEEPLTRPGAEPLPLRADLVESQA